MKRSLHFIALIAAAVLPLSWANGQASLQFNNNSSNMVGGSPQTVNIVAGGTFMLSLQIVASVPTNAVDYWLAQAFGPTLGAFTITSVSYAGSDYPDPSFTGSFAADQYSNSTNTAAGNPDGIIDGRLEPRDGPDLGSSTTTLADVAAGTHQIATFTFQVANDAAGTYQIQSYDYAGFGWSSTTLSDQPFDAQAAINIDVTAVPEPSTWSMLILGGLGTVGLVAIRRRRHA